MAEILLQKTKALDVEPVWSQVVARFRTASGLAKADVDEVRQIVSPLGLGDQRSKRLHAMATFLD